jgi:predicted P-loop ATPase
MKQLREKYDDLKAEWMTLKQTNQEYKRTLADKVKEHFRMQKEIDVYKAKTEINIADLTAESDARLQVLTSL